AFGAYWFASRTMDAEAEVISSFVSIGQAAQALLQTPLGAIALSLGVTILFLVVRTLLRLDLLAGIVTVAVLFPLGGGLNSVVDAMVAGSFAIIAVVALTRFGLLALMGVFLASEFSGLIRAGLAWGVGPGVFLLAIIVAMTTFAAYVA